jgi:membrane protein
VRASEATGLTALRALQVAAANAREHNLTVTAKALAFSLFLAIPSAILLLLGVFSLVSDADDVSRLMRELEAVAPAEAVELLGQSLERTVASPRSGVIMALVGFALAAWSATSAATSLMEGINAAVGRSDGRGFVRRRLVALAIVACLVAAALLVLGLLVLGPHLADWIGRASGRPGLTTWLWWTAQWPILLVGLLFAFGVVLNLGPDLQARRLRIVTPGTVVALVVWLVASAALAVYSARFGSFEKTWGTLSAVVVTLLWLWLSSAALLFGAELDAVLDGSREDEDRREDVDARAQGQRAG